MTKHATRNDIDLLIQSTTVELFHAYGVAVAPTRRNSMPPPPIDADCTGTISFAAPRFTGNLTLTVPVDVLKLMQHAPGSSPALKDWIRELTNQLLGRLKNRLLRFQVVLQVGLPTNARGRAGPSSAESTTRQSVYVFRTLRGRIFVAVSGNLDPSALQFSGSLNLAGEGDVILF